MQERAELDDETLVHVRGERPLLERLGLFRELDERRKTSAVVVRRLLAADRSLFNEKGVADLSHGMARCLPGLQLPFPRLAGRQERTVLQLNEQAPQGRGRYPGIGAQILPKGPAVVVAPGQIPAAANRNVYFPAIRRFMAVAAEKFSRNHAAAIGSRVAWILRARGLFGKRHGEAATYRTADTCHRPRARSRSGTSPSPCCQITSALFFGISPTRPRVPAAEQLLEQPSD